MWMGVLVAVTCIIALLRRTPKPSVPVIPLTPEVVRRYFEVYEDKSRILSELKSIEQRVRKGRLPRRRYKVRKRNLEGRLSVISRNLTNIREEIRAAGPTYFDLMRRIEVAETELEGVEADVRRVEARYRRKELSSEAYRKLLEEYRRRKERAETTLDGLLLRLREEIH
jgi:chromosome segregation ATPase